MNTCPVHWPRAIALIDMNAFFASVDQRDFPSLLGQPVAITNGLRGSCVITSSYEARACGVRTGMRLPEARRLCPALVQRPARPEVYARVSTNIMQALHDVCPDMEVFSVDEAFVDITPCQRLYGTPVRAARLLRQAVYNASGLLCSVGLSGDKTTAKFAAKLNKPNGFTVIPPWEAKDRLRDVPVTELCGIAEGIGRFLADYGVTRCGDMEKLPISILARRFGNPGRRIWYMCQGADPDPLHPDVAAPKSLGHGKVMPPGTRSREVVLTYLQHMCSKVGARLRRHELEARTFWVGLAAAVQLGRRQGAAAGVFQRSPRDLQPLPRRAGTGLAGRGRAPDPGHRAGPAARIHPARPVRRESGTAVTRPHAAPGDGRDQRPLRRVHAVTGAIAAAFGYAQRDRPGVEAGRASADDIGGQNEPSMIR